MGVNESTKQHKATTSKQFNFAVFICSTSRYQQLQKGENLSDISGDAIEALLKNAGHKVLSKKIIADDKRMI
ncbi:hypothetical protein G4O51_03510 [Candidatus Bathyarchaeota archaeon A05DMB-2]|jgi:molybdopterin biosynthesis enzyme MoaB|nr:hypothetical protein [Candidatus Bathyarchaeota archaeon A05DMB-2]